MLKVSVNGSQDGAWGLTQSLLEHADYHGAIAKWETRHTSRTIDALVQFKGVYPCVMPRVYLAKPAEIGARLRETAKGRGDTMLHEEHTWGPRAVGFGNIERIPAAWAFSSARIDILADQLVLRPSRCDHAGACSADRSLIYAVREEAKPVHEAEGLGQGSRRIAAYEGGRAHAECADLAPNDDDRAPGHRDVATCDG